MSFLSLPYRIGWGLCGSLNTPGILITTHAREKDDQKTVMINFASFKAERFSEESGVSVQIGQWYIYMTSEMTPRVRILTHFTNSQIPF